MKEGMTGYIVPDATHSNLSLLRPKIREVLYRATLTGFYFCRMYRTYMFVCKESDSASGQGGD